MRFDATSVSILLGVLLGISELLAQIPWIKSNSIFQFIVSVIRMLAGGNGNAKK